MYRILKPGGKLVLTTPAPCSKPLLEFLAFRLKIISAEEIMDLKHYFSNSEIKDILNNYGFSEVPIKNFQFGFNQLAVGTKSD